MRRSVLALLGAYLMIVVLVMGAMGLGLWLDPGAFHLEQARVDPPWLAVMLGSGFCAAFLGGSLVGRMAGRAPFFHALMLGSLLLAVWFVDVAVSPIEVPTWFQIGNLLAGVFGVLLGGGVRSWRTVDKG